MYDARVIVFRINDIEADVDVKKVEDRLNRKHVID